MELPPACAKRCPKQKERAGWRWKRKCMNKKPKKMDVFNLESLITITIFVVTGILLLKDYKIIVEPKKRTLTYVILKVFVSLFIVLLFFIRRFENFSVPWHYLFISIMFAFVLFISILILIRMLWKSNIWYIFLFVPIGVLFSIFLTDFNRPLYSGAMDGFAAAVRAYIEILVICFIYPLCIFSYKMLKMKRIIKSTLIISISVVSFARGITLSIGREGYLSDTTGDWFLFFCIWLVLIGLFGLLTQALLN